MNFCCPHPVTNATDDYSGVACCCCDGNPCPAVTPQMQATHDALLLAADPGVGQAVHQAQALIGAIEEYEDAHPKGAPCFAAALEVMRQAVA